MAIQTVLGKVNKNELGIIMPHEHIFIDLTAFYTERVIPGCSNPGGEKVTIRNLGILSRDPYALRDDLVIDDFNAQCDELIELRNAGCSTIVDASSIGLGRDPRMLKSIAQATGLNVVMGSGYYVDATHSDALREMTVEQIAGNILRDIRDGADGTNIKPGVIGEIGISEDFTPSEKRVLRAAGIAQRETGLGILLHINPWTTFGLEAVDILFSEGVAPDRIAVCHSDVENRIDYMESLLQKGVYVEFDNFGKEYYVAKSSRHKGYGTFVHDTDRVDLLAKLLSKGYEKQLLLSCDVCLKILLHRYGGWGYDHVLTNIIPMLKEEGVLESTIEQMIRWNPADFLER
ncbi:MAG: hypothetical protein LLF75_00545 [Eubacteriales bacterium]|nr:hypothetical protein [Eubacteriales bacterium]